MAVTLTSPDYDAGLTGVTFIIDRENGTSIAALPATEVSAYPGTYSLSTTVTNAPVGYNRVRMLDSDNVLRMIFAVQVIADGQATVTGGSVQGLKDRAGNLAEHDATQAAIAAISLTGSGARTVTITVTDGTNPLVSVLVRVTSGSNSFTSLTNGSGVITFNLDDGTWTVALTKAGYSYAGSSIVVNGTETATLVMTALTFPSSPAGQTTGYWYVYDEVGAIDAGAIVNIAAINAPRTSTGLVLLGAVRQATSDVNGLLTVTGLFPGVTYKASRQSSSREFIITVPSNSGATVALGSIVG